MGHRGNIGKMAATLPLGDDTMSILHTVSYCSEDFAICVCNVHTEQNYFPRCFLSLTISPPALGDNPMIDKISSKQDQTLRITSAKEREDGLCRTLGQVRWSPLMQSIEVPFKPGPLAGPEYQAPSNIASSYP